MVSMHQLPGSSQLDGVKETLYMGWKPVFRNTIYTGVNFHGLELEGSDFAGSSFLGCDFHSANLSGSNLKNTNFQGSNLGYSVLNGADFSGSNLLESLFNYSHMRDCNLSNCQIRHSDLNYCDLENADFTGSNLSRSNLSNTNLRSSNLTNVEMLGVETHGVVNGIESLDKHEMLHTLLERITSESYTPTRYCLGGAMAEIIGLPGNTGAGIISIMRSDSGLNLGALHTSSVATAIAELKRRIESL